MEKGNGNKWQDLKKGITKNVKMETREREKSKM